MINLFIVIDPRYGSRGTISANRGPGCHLSYLRLTARYWAMESVENNSWCPVYHKILVGIVRCEVMAEFFDIVVRSARE